MIPFSPPRIDQKIIDEVVQVLKSGWITTGPRTKMFEKKLAQYTGVSNVLCLNSATAGLEIMLRWLGVGPGDEVILPAYTYSATANVVMHTGATPILVDVNDDDFCINLNRIRSAITERTKVIMPVDFAGWPCDYKALYALVNEKEVKLKFIPANDIQHKLNRIMILADAAHSLGAITDGVKSASIPDVAVYSFHAVKNLTTAEGGAIVLNLPAPFDNAAIYNFLCVYTLHGQNKDALAKMQKGNWRYDIVEAGYKCNMTDINAAMGLIELERYDDDTLVKRKHICNLYSQLLNDDNVFQLPVMKSDTRETSYHLYPLRVRNITEQQRDDIMKHIFDDDITVNVHFIPLPMLSYYRKKNYSISDYPVTYNNYSREISLPVFYDLTDEQIHQVVASVKNAVKKVVEL